MDFSERFFTELHERMRDKSRDDDPPGHPVGFALRWDEFDLLRLSQLGDPQTEAEARDLWREHAGALKTLLDAKVDDGEAR